MRAQQRVEAGRRRCEVHELICAAETTADTTEATDTAADAAEAANTAVNRQIRVVICERRSKGSKAAFMGRRRHEK